MVNKLVESSQQQLIFPNQSLPNLSTTQAHLFVWFMLRVKSEKRTLLRSFSPFARTEIHF